MASTTVPAKMPTLPFTARDFPTIQRELLRLIQATRAKDVNTFFEGDVGKILVELLAYIGAMESYAIDRVSQEAFISTMQRYESALRFAAGFSYPVATTNGASVDLVPSSYAAIPSGFSVSTSSNCKQLISLAGSPTGGTFLLSFMGETLGGSGLSYAATAIEVQAALASITTIGQTIADGVVADNVSVTGEAGGPWTVEFVEEFRFQVQPLIEADGALLTRNEVQTITLTQIGGLAISGTFTLTFAGQTTAAIAYNAAAATVQSALESLSNIAPGDIDVSGDAGGPWTIEFMGTYENTDVSTLVLTSSLTNARDTVEVLVEGGTPGDPTVAVLDPAAEDKTVIAYFTAGQTLSAAGYVWTVTRDVTINGGDITPTNYQEAFVIPVAAGTPFTEVFASTGQEFQDFTTQVTDVIQSSIEIRVGSPTADPWTLVDTLALASGTENAYTIRFNAKGQATIRFGDNTTGAIPTNTAAVYVKGRTGGGLNTNVGPGAILASLEGQTVNPRSPDERGSGSVSLTNLVSASGGRDAETLEELRRNIPAWIRTVDKAITKEDYDTLAGAYESGNGAISRAVSYLRTATIMYQTSGPDISETSPFELPAGTSISISNEAGTYEFTTSTKFYADVTDPILFLNPNTVDVWVWSIGDRGFTGSSSSLQADVRAYLQDRSVITTTIFVHAGETKTIDIDLGEVTYFSNYNEETVREAIIQATKDFFFSDSIQPGRPFRLSDYYDVIEAVPGVDHFVISTVNAATPADISVLKREIPYLGTLDFSLVVSKLPLDDDPNRAAFGDELYGDGTTV